MRNLLRSTSILLLALFLAQLFKLKLAVAQSITQANDSTGTIIKTDGNRIDIQGGSLSGDGANLFHSFRQFNLNSGEIANFLSHPNIKNILGRVTGGDASIINGSIQVSGGNSHLFLMNPSGVIFGPSASLNVLGSFTATTATGIGFKTNGSNNWFNATGLNNYVTLVGEPSHFAFNTSQPGSIINAGHLAVALGQNLSLIGGNIINTGVLTAREGNITLAAVPGSSLVRISQPGYLLSWEIDPKTTSATTEITPLTLTQLLTGRGKDMATGVRVSSTGQVLLVSGMNLPTDGGVAIASGKLDVSGESGGTVRVLGNKVGLVGTNINASGTHGGGTAIVGGDFQGKGTVPNASQTFTSSDSTINADALIDGNGGRVIVWAGETNRFLGKITARGGVNSGNGGFVETSGKTLLEALGNVDASAVNGVAGSWLLDPNNITIQTAGANTAVTSSPSFTTTEDNAIVTTGSIESALNQGTSVTITTATAGTNSQSGNITVANNISKTSGGDATLTLQAANNIVIEKNVQISSASNKLHVTLNADADSSGAGNITLTNATINSNGGDIILGGGSNLLSTASTGTNRIEVSLTNSNLNTGTGNISIKGTAAFGSSDLLGTDIQNGNLGQTNRIGSLADNKPLSSTGTPMRIGNDNKGIAIDRGINPGSQVGGIGSNLGSIDLRNSAIASLAKGGPIAAVPHIEQLIDDQYKSYYGKDFSGVPQTTESIQQSLGTITSQTGKKPAIIYILSQPEQLEIVAILPGGKALHKSVPAANRETLLKTIKEFRNRVTDRTSSKYLAPAQQLYQWSIAPIEDILKSERIDTLLFSVDSGLRSIPMAALHDGHQFLVQKYSIGLIPSVSLIDTRYKSLQNASILAMGASKFQNQNSLPGVAVELPTIAQLFGQEHFFLNEDFTVNNLLAQRSQRSFEIIHLATHGEFNSGALSNSYIQFWDNKLQLDQLRSLKLNNPSVELLVLSACRTALGNEQAEFGFAGLAVQAGVKSALASLWYVSDEGTLGLMSEFYNQLKHAPIKAEALRQAQIAMIEGKVRLENGKVRSTRGAVSLPSELSTTENHSLSHPYFWAAFTMIGSPW